jgi:cytochrome c
MRVLALGLAISGLVISALAAPAFAEGDPAAGEKVFKKCASCHAIGEGAKNKVGPELNNLIGRVAGSHPDFKYSSDMVAAGQGGLVWSADTLHQFLTKPKDLVKGTKMSFPGLKEQADIDNIVAYLSTFSTAPVADPAAAPAQ